jgi:hypothetical protein
MGTSIPANGVEEMRTHATDEECGNRTLCSQYLVDKLPDKHGMVTDPADATCPLCKTRGIRKIQAA